MLHSYRLYKKKWKTLSSNDLNIFEEDMEQLDREILNKNQRQSSELAQKLQAFTKEKIRYNFFDYFKEFILTCFIAFIFAVVFRQMVFEPYQIPTGSMRPSFKEEDRLIASKTSFGINIPCFAKHLSFDPKLVKHSNNFLFTAQNLNMYDPDTKYFYLFPGKKRLIKRCMGKGGDTIYFYGGKIYGFDKNGQDLKELRQAPWLEKIEHIPFSYFEGNQFYGPLNQAIVLKQMNLPLARITLLPGGKVKGEIKAKDKWQEEILQGKLKQDPKRYRQDPKRYSDFWGIANYAHARLIKAKELKTKEPEAKLDLEKSTLYLELKHHPNLRHPSFIQDLKGNIYPQLKTYTSLIPLKKEHMKKIMDAMYTSRFYLKEGRALRYRMKNPLLNDAKTSPYFPKAKDGIYEFYYGKAYKVKDTFWQQFISNYGGRPKELKKDHPLYESSENKLIELFNKGIHIIASDRTSRYAYFREGDLYLMGHPILTKDDPALSSFIHREKQRALKYQLEGYLPFIDEGPPLYSDGRLDYKKIQNFGLKIPEGFYLALGDNHAQSSDSRDFGFIPEENIRGSAKFLIWPIGKRFGSPPQYFTAFFTFPFVVVWSTIVFLSLVAFFYQRKMKTYPIFKKCR